MDTKKLRQKILDLAIHGKLVPQDPNDEPASVLLERIKAEKEQLIKEGKIKRQKKSASSDTSHYGNAVPFEVPEGWVWCNITEITYKITDGTHHSPISYPRGDYMYVTAKNIKESGVSLDNMTFVTSEVFRDVFSRCNPELGDILYIKDGATTGVVTINDIKDPFCLLSSVALIKPSKSIDRKYLLYYLRSSTCYSSVRESMKGVGITRVTLKQIENWVVPIPPLSEQKRIVDEVEKWFVQIDAIEQDSSDLKDAVQKAKSKILDLALSGRLTSDTSHYRKWPYLPLSEIFNITMGQSPEGYYINQNNDGVEFHQGKLHFGQRHLLNSGVFTSNITKVADACSLLMCVRAPVGVLNITNREVCIGRGLCALKPKDSNMPIEYWYYALSSLSNYFEENSTGSTFKAITMDVIKTTYVYVPPVNEQRLIVRQLEHIYKIIDSILNHLTP